VQGEEKLLDKWVKQDSEFFNTIDATVYYIERQIEDYLEALEQDREPLVNGEDGRKTVELFTAIYRSQRDNQPIKFPLKPEVDKDDFDGRLSK
jgi:UDP-N-acetyl-2-amino-2-deoxyglucuronate dehydrogenase